MDINKLGRYTALFSFLVGTFILLAYLFTGQNHFQLIGLCFLLLAVVSNILILVKVIVTLIKEQQNRRKHIVTAFVMLINIPIAVGYISYVESYQKRLPVMFINDTGETINKLEIYKGDILIESVGQLSKEQGVFYRFNKFDAYNINLQYTIRDKEYSNQDIIRVNTDKILEITPNPYSFGIGRDTRIYVDEPHCTGWRERPCARHCRASALVIKFFSCFYKGSGRFQTFGTSGRSRQI